MASYALVPGVLYRVMDGVRRAKAAHLLGHTLIRALVVDASGQALGECDIPLDLLRSPKTLIRRITTADETRWKRAIAGANQSVLPYPPITIQPDADKGTRIEDVDFDFGGQP